MRRTRTRTRRRTRTQPSTVDRCARGTEGSTGGREKQALPDAADGEAVRTCAGLRTGITYALLDAATWPSLRASVARDVDVPRPARISRKGPSAPEGEDALELWLSPPWGQPVPSRWEDSLPVRGLKMRVLLFTRAEVGGSPGGVRTFSTELAVADAISWISQLPTISGGLPSNPSSSFCPLPCELLSCRKFFLISRPSFVSSKERPLLGSVANGCTGISLAQRALASRDGRGRVEDGRGHCKGPLSF
ncbi:hypothetical protein C8Q70DRAFT_738927 [Cubamyces menziesii]|nr:hypothetical protein C8Q70DRAFT_738927 [Cubamyces menziesii]